MRRVISVTLFSALVLTAFLKAAPSTTPVADAAMKGDRDAVRALLKQGGDVGAAQGDGMTALHWAAERGDAEMAGMLIYAGANVGAVTRIGLYTPLHLAAKSGHVEVVDALLKAGAAVDARAMPTGATPLHLAAGSGTPATINRLIDAGADKNAKEAEWGQTPLMFAASSNRVEVITALLAKGADPELTTKVIDIVQRNALDRAASARQRRVLQSFGVGPERQPSASQVQAAVQASRDVFLSGKVPPPDKNDPADERDRDFNP